MKQTFIFVTVINLFVIIYAVFNNWLIHEIIEAIVSWYVFLFIPVWISSLIYEADKKRALKVNQKGDLL